jgi:molybdate transport system substrate-binding protein
MTMPIISRLGISLMLSIAACTAGAADAGELRVLSAAAMQSVFKETVGEFERTSGHTVTIRYGAIGGITQRVLAGETADLVIASTVSMRVS